MLCTHCSRIMASCAALRALLSSKSTPSKVGGTVGLEALKDSDSGVGMADNVPSSGLFGGGDETLDVKVGVNIAFRQAVGVEVAW